METVCCPCNGQRARCVRCRCIKDKRPCSSCLPGRNGRCQNSGRSTSPCPPSASQDDQFIPDSPRAPSLDHSQRSPSLFSSPGSNQAIDTDPSDHLLTSAEVDSLMNKAFRSSLIRSGGHCDPTWSPHWEKITRLSGNH